MITGRKRFFASSVTLLQVMVSLMVTWTILLLLLPFIIVEYLLSDSLRFVFMVEASVGLVLYFNFISIPFEYL